MGDFPEPFTLTVDFHRRGLHVQHAHRRNFASDGSHLSGAMVALIPTAEDARRLAINGGEKMEDLHLTLFYLGKGADFSEEERTDLIKLMRGYASDLPGPVLGKIFGVAHWNGGGDEPSWVWSVGDDPEADHGLQLAHTLAVMAVENMISQPELPTQHTPWVAHICAAYTKDLTLVKELEKRNGPVEFDRIRVVFADQATDIPLGKAMTAGGLLRRNLKDHEIGTDFEAHQGDWEESVDTTLSGLNTVIKKWRSSIASQVKASLEDERPDRLASITVSTVEARVLIEKQMITAAERAGQQMQREAEAQGVTVPDWSISATLAALSGRRLLSSVAQMTADALSGQLLAGAKRRVTQLLGLSRTPDEIAKDVEETLADMSDSGQRAALGTAMTTAQNTGRRAVLEVAPPATYYASEILDKNTCAECRRADGEEFATLKIAIKAYPVSGYKDCIGSRYGNNCRGMIIARWNREDDQTTATMRADGDQLEETSVSTATETLGGKPSEGTKKDKRLHENTYADMDCPEGEDCPEIMAEHLAITELVSLAWDGAASRFSDAEYKRATAACDSGEGTIKDRCFLPHHEPGGALNEAGLSAAAGRANQLSDRSAAAQARAKSHLRGHYNKLGKPVPSNLKATEEEVAAFALEDDYDLIIWGNPVEFAMDDGGCPENMMKDPATGECGPTKASGQTAPWEGVLAVEDQVTGDGREFAGGALTWSENIEPGEVLLRWNKEDSHGGEVRTKAVTVGRIDEIWRDGTKIMGKGVFDLGSEDGAEAHRRVQEKFLRGVSIDADSIGNADVEFVWPENAGADEDADPLMMLLAAPEKVIYHGGRIRAATLCDIPAFAEAYIALTDETGAVVAGGAPSLEQYTEAQSTIARKRAKSLARPDRLTSALVAHAAPTWRPPAEWFENPQLSQPTTIHVTEDGRVFGHAAQWGACHIGFMDVCTQPPREDDFPYFATGELITDSGKVVTVGQITVTADHADLFVAAGPAKQHYENTGNAVADVAVGSDRIGIWVAGAIRPNADPMLVHELRASGEVSGDWRRIGGQHRLVGLLGVNVGGFVVPRMKARVAGGQIQALIAAGRLTTAHVHPAAPEPVDRKAAYKIVMDDLAAQMFTEDNEGSE